MKMIPVKIKNGLLKISSKIKIPRDAQLSILLREKDDENVFFFEGNKSFDFLEDEPDLYSDKDVLPNRRNEKFLQ